jgi:hypothetical protein
MINQKRACIWTRVNAFSMAVQGRFLHGWRLTTDPAAMRLRAKTPTVKAIVRALARKLAE